MEKQLEEIRSFNRQRLLILEEERNKMQEEKNELERYLNKLMDDLAALHSTAVLELGVQRLENICITLLKAADENSRQIMENAGTKISHLQNQVKTIDSQIEDAKIDIQRELNIVIKMLGGSANPKVDSIMKALEKKVLNDFPQNKNRRSDSVPKTFVPKHSELDFSLQYPERSGFYEKETAAGSLFNSVSMQKSQDMKEKGLSQEGLKTKIDNARYKYMIDKLAGEQLLDNSGEIILEKNERITLEHIEKAQREGKLSELIINMIIPGMDQMK
ncbi:MAG: hypothetical protein GX434_07525 [Peptococcaceae bacterium]|nr:hypothetical protein [Peptococcaceae bacterium]